MVKFRWMNAGNVEEKYNVLREAFGKELGDDKSSPIISVAYFDINGRFNEVRGNLSFISDERVEGRTSPYIEVEGERIKYHPVLGEENFSGQQSIPITQIRDFKRSLDHEFLAL